MTTKTNETTSTFVAAVSAMVVSESTMRRNMTIELDNFKSKEWKELKTDESRLEVLSQIANLIDSEESILGARLMTFLKRHFDKSIKWNKKQSAFVLTGTEGAKFTPAWTKKQSKDWWRPVNSDKAFDFEAAIKTATAKAKKENIASKDQIAVLRKMINAIEAS